MRYQYREIFNQLLSLFGYSGKQVAVWAGVHESKISRFRTGKLDLEAGEFFQMLQSMPEEAQSYFWEQMLGRAVSAEQLVKGMDDSQIRQLLLAIAACWGKQDRHQNGHQDELQVTIS